MCASAARFLANANSDYASRAARACRGIDSAKKLEIEFEVLSCRRWREVNMAKARKAAAKSKRSKRPPKTKSKSRRSKRPSIRKRRRKTQPGIADKLASAVLGQHRRNVEDEAQGGVPRRHRRRVIGDCRIRNAALRSRLAMMNTRRISEYRSGFAAPNAQLTAAARRA